MSADRLTDDSGNVLVIVVLIGFIVGALASLGLSTGRQADWSSASDRNHEQALAVAEAGVHTAISKIAASSEQGDTSFWDLAPGQTVPAACEDPASLGSPDSCPQARTTEGFNGETSEGSYWYWVTRTIDGFVVDAQARAGGDVLGRGRHIRATLAPPLRFHSSDSYAIYSKTSIDIQSGDQILDGDVFANQWIDIGNAGSVNPSVRGSVTSATGWIRLQGSVRVTGNVWSGGPHANGAIRMDNGAVVDGWAKASSSVPGCEGQTASAYNVPLGNGAIIRKTLTTFGQKSGAGSVTGTIQPNTCTAAADPPAFPAFTYDPDHYGLLNEFDSLTAFRTWFSANKSNFKGAFHIRFDPAIDGTLSMSNRVNLSGAMMTGPVTIITEAPPPAGPNDAGYGIAVSTENISDANVVGDSIFVVVSHYKPPAGSVCSTEGADSDCAVQIKNNFATDASGACKTASLIYADNGPVAIKNSGKTCGSVISNGVQVKNGLTLQYDQRIDRVIGFGPTAYDIARWEELAAR